MKRDREVLGLSDFCPDDVEAIRNVEPAAFVAEFDVELAAEESRSAVDPSLDARRR